MSAPHIIAAIEDGPASQADTMVLIALADFADKEGRCWPSMATIAKKARMSERGARNCVQRLIADGWLVIERGGGRSCSNGYLVRISDKPNAARQPTQRTDGAHGAMGLHIQNRGPLGKMECGHRQACVRDRLSSALCRRTILDRYDRQAQGGAQCALRHPG